MTLSVWQPRQVPRVEVPQMSRDVAPTVPGGEVVVIHVHSRLHPNMAVLSQY
jgi:hypothetical protein